MYICISIALATKAEFDALAADFNARLTSFEAGINSKIDSQVTTYLDRNGIWSAAEQDVVNPIQSHYGFRKGSGHSAKTMLAYEGPWNLQSGQSVYSLNLYNTTTSAWNDDESYSLTNKVWVNSITKSGLLMAQLVDQIKMNGDLRCRISALGSYYADDCSKTAYIVNLRIMREGDTVPLFSKDIIQSYGCTSVSMVCPPLTSGPVLFFVKRGQKLTWDFTEQILKKTSSGTYSTSLTIWNTSEGTENTRSFSISTPAVY